MPDQTQTAELVRLREIAADDRFVWGEGNRKAITEAADRLEALSSLRSALQAEIAEQRAAERAAIDMRDRARADNDPVSALVHDEWRQSAQAFAERLYAILAALHTEEGESSG